MKEEASHQPLGSDIARDIRHLLEDFESVGFGDYSALIPSDNLDSCLRENVTAALIASALDLSSVDYAKKKYRSEKIISSEMEPMRSATRYTKAYLTSKNYIKIMLSKASHAIVTTPQWGSFGARIALTRLEYSFFSAHILYQLGHRYEAHAISRLILEQIAWAYSASQLESLDDIKRLVTTNCIGKLKKLNQDYGRLYGILSNKVHIDYGNHREFLRVEDGASYILHSHSNFTEYAFVILSLADLFGIVWEISQAAFIQDFEATEITDGVRTIRKDRPFYKIISEHLAELRSERGETDVERETV